MKTTEELVEETVSKSVKSAVLVALRSINFQEVVLKIIKEQIPRNELDDIYNNGYIPANKVNFSAYSFRDFMSTGIEDTSENLQLKVSKDNVQVENNLTSKTIKVIDSLEAGKQLRAKVLDIVGSSLLSGDTLMLGKLTTKGNNEFLGDGLYITSRALNGINFRSENLGSFENIEANSMDFYASMRSLYLQDRENKIKNNQRGRVEVIYQDEEDWEEIDTK